MRKLGLAQIAWGRKEARFAQYELLCNLRSDDLVWAPGRGGSLPLGAVVGGVCHSGEPKFVARAQVGVQSVPGCLVKSRGRVAFVLDGREVVDDRYEVLCVRYVVWFVGTEVVGRGNVLYY